MLDHRRGNLWAGAEVYGLGCMLAIRYEIYELARKQTGWVVCWIIRDEIYELARK